jgi:Tol biopolymer transport system component
VSYEEILPDYPRFTEPQIVATNAIGFSIAEWLPDSQRLLVSEGDGAFGTIFILDITIGAALEYAQRRDLSGSTPIWLDEKQGVMFVDATAEGWDLRFSDGRDTVILAQHLASTFIAKSLFSGHVTIAFSSEPGALMTIDTDAQTRQLTTVDLDETTRQIPLSSTDAYRLAESPDSNWIAQYRGENLYLINVKTQTICRMDLGDYGEAGPGHVFYAHWSPNSRYLGLAIKRQKAIPELNVLNIETGELHILSLPLDTTSWPPESIGSAVWSPDSQKILVQVTSRNSEMTKTDAEWLLVDIPNWKFMYPLPNYTFAPGVGNIVWSPDGSKVAFSCPTHGKGNICIMEVEWQQ